MRLAVLADVHANLHALTLVIERLSSQRITRYVCAGDLVGYGPYPNECVAHLRELDALCVAGNHDLMAVGRLSVDSAGRLARRTLLWTQEVLQDTTRDFLLSLPTVAELSSTVVSHGAVGDPTTYVRGADQAADELDRLSRRYATASVLVLGHTHQPFAYARRAGRLTPSPEGTVELPPGDVVLLNPGSVGQPRERAPLVRFMVLDLEAREATFHALALDVQACRRELRRRGLPPAACHRPPSRIRSVRSWIVRRTRAKRLVTRWRAARKGTTPDR